MGKNTIVLTAFYTVLLTVFYLPDPSLGKPNHHHNHESRGERTLVLNDAPRGPKTGPREPAWSSRPWFVDIRMRAGLNCRCVSFQTQWTNWSPCSSSGAGCYAATQMRTRQCQRECSRIQTRNCLDRATCTGKWGPWITNSSCSQCKEGGTKPSFRLCMTEDGVVGPYCRGTERQIYQEKDVDCNQVCQDSPDEIPSGRTPGDGQFASQSNNGKPSGWIESSKGNLIVILLAVFAGVLLVGLIFVSVMFASLKRRKLPRRRSTTRGRRSPSESNVSATSFLSADKDSRASARIHMYEQNKNGARRSLMLPPNLATLSMNVNGTSSVRVKGPMQHTDSLMLVRKNMNNKRTNKGSVRSINKLMREKSRTSRQSADDQYLTGSISFREETEMIPKHRESTLKRSATDGAYDTYERRKQRQYLAEGTNTDYGSVGATVNAPNDSKESDKTEQYYSSSQEKVCNSDGDESMDGAREKSRIRMSVDDIRRIFESRSADHSPVRSTPKSTAAVSNGSHAVGDNISKFEASTKSNDNASKPKRFFGSFKRRKSQTTVISAKQIDGIQQQQQQSKGPDDKKMTSEQKNDLDVTDQENEEEFNATKSQGEKAAFHSHTEKRPKKKTFLFSPQAYSSLQRSTASRPRKASPSTNGFKMDIDAMMKKTEGGENRSSTSEDVTTFRKDRPKSFEDLSGNAIVVPPRRAIINSYDSDAYADVWDAKVKESDMPSSDSIYADVWDSSTSRRSICENDDDDYSEVYDAATKTSNVDEARRLALQNSTSFRSRAVSQGTASRTGVPPPRPRTSTHIMFNEAKGRMSQAPASCGSSPVRPPLPIRRTPQRASRESSNESNSSAPHDSILGQDSLISSSELQMDPIYAVI